MSSNKFKGSGDRVCKVSVIDSILVHDLFLSSWEVDFLKDMRKVLEDKTREPSDKERSMLFKIAKKMEIFKS